MTAPTRRAWASGMRAHGHDAGKWRTFDVWAHRRLLSTRMECSANYCFVELPTKLSIILIAGLPIFVFWRDGLVLSNRNVRYFV
jgi:hypothetical protein